MPDSGWLAQTSPAFQLMIATSWLAPEPWRDKQEQAIRRCFASGVDWTEFVGLVDRHRTAGLSWAALKRTSGLVIPESATRELTRRSDQCRLQALQHLQILIGILRLFHRAGISAMVLKGPLLSLDLYEDAALRQSRDLDLLVPQEHIRDAEKLLEQTGWRRGPDYPSLTPRQWQLTLKVEHHVGYVDPKSGCLLELHWRAGWDTAEMTANRWARSLPDNTPRLYLSRDGSGQPGSLSRQSRRGACMVPGKMAGRRRPSVYKRSGLEAYLGFRERHASGTGSLLVLNAIGRYIRPSHAGGRRSLLRTATF